MLQAEQLSKTFYPARQAPVHAVRAATFRVEGGEVLGLLGPNGAGKTTLLRMLATILKPTSGHCWIDRVRADTAPDAIRGRLGFLSGNTRLYGRLTPREVLRYFGRLYGLDRQQIEARTAELADLLDMGAFVNRRCETLSTGQTQKVSIARVILHDPPVLILDEPTLGLDILTSRAIIDFVLDARARGRCIIYSTHYMTEAERLCDRVGLIYNGRIAALGTRDELCARTQTDNLHDAFLQTVATEREAAA